MLVNNNTPSLIDYEIIIVTKFTYIAEIT